MASSSSRKSNSSASKQKPTFRRSTGAASARTSTAKSRPVAASPKLKKVAPARTYVAPTKKAASELVSSSKSVRKKVATPRRRQVSAAPTPTRRPASAKTAPKAASKTVAKPTLKATAKPTVKAQTKALAKAAPQKRSAAAKQAKPAKPAKRRATASIQTAAKRQAKSASRSFPMPKVPSVLGLKLSKDDAARPERPRAGLGTSVSFLHVAVAVVLAAVVVIGLGAAVVVNSGFFEVTSVVVNGSEHVPQQTAAKLVSVPVGSTLFNLDEDDAVENLKENPWVDDVRVERQFPHTLVITPQEKTVAAIAYIVSDGVAWAISDENTWIAPISLAVTTQPAPAEDAPAEGSGDDGSAETWEGEAVDEGAETDETVDEGADAGAQGGEQLTGVDAAMELAREANAVLLTDVGTDAGPSSGKEVTNEVVLAGLAYATGFSPEFRAQIKDISIPSIEAISANLDSGVEVSLGKPEDIQQKEQVIRKLLEQEQGVTYINVRVADAYSFRSAPV